jgi:hypothetical protein
MTKRDGRALWRALQENEAADDFEEIMAMSDEEVDAYINGNGGDAKAIRVAGAKLAKELREDPDRFSKREKAHAKVQRYREWALAMGEKERLPRDALLRLLDEARHDPRFSAPVASMFHDKKPEESTDEELRAMLDQIALLVKLDGDRDKDKDK